MKKLLKIVAIVLMAAMELTMILCMSCAGYVTPNWLDEEAMVFAGFDPNKSKLLPWTTQHQGKKLARAISYTHLMNQLTFQFMIDEEQARYDYVSNAQSLYNKESEQLQERWLAPTGPMAMLIGGMGFTLGSLLVPPPGTKKKLEDAEAKGRREANGNTA